jgi:hypothetical protein
MMSQQQNDIHVTEEGTPPLHDQQQPSEPAWKSWSFWFRVIGVVLTFVGYYVIDQWIVSNSSWYIAPLILVGVVGAGLTRSWWSLLVVAVAFSLWFFSSPFGSFVGSGETNVLIVGAWLFILMLLEIGAVGGTFIGKWIEEWLRH